MLVETVFTMPHELKLTKKQFHALVRDVHSQMMKGGAGGDYGAPAQIPDFSGQDIGFFVEDGGMEGGGWRDTLSSVWNSVKKHVLSSKETSRFLGRHFCTKHDTMRWLSAVSNMLLL